MFRILPPFCHPQRWPRSLLLAQSELLAPHWLQGPCALFSAKKPFCSLLQACYKGLHDALKQNVNKATSTRDWLFSSRRLLVSFQSTTPTFHTSVLGIGHKVSWVGGRCNFEGFTIWPPGFRGKCCHCFLSKNAPAQFSSGVSSLWRIFL